MRGIDFVKNSYDNVYNIVQTRILNSPAKTIPARLVAGVASLGTGYYAANVAASVGKVVANAGLSGFQAARECFNASSCMQYVNASTITRTLPAVASDNVPFVKQALCLVVFGAATVWLAKKALPVKQEIQQVLAARAQAKTPATGEVKAKPE